MNETRLVATDGTEIKVLNVPKEIVEYAEYYTAFTNDGLVPMSYEDWKRTKIAAEKAEAEARKAYAEFYS